MLSTRPLLCLLAAIAVCKTEAGLIENYPFPENSDIPDFGIGMRYSPINFATIASLDLDLRSIDAYIAVANSQNGIDIAQKLYEQGAFSDVFANLKILDPTGKYATSETNIVAGATVVGKTASGKAITGIAKYGKTETLNGSEGSENILQVHYPAVSVADTNFGCFVGGNPTPVTDGCFAPSGTITVSGFDTTYTFQYSYQPTYDNVNGLSLSSMDRLRGQVVNTSPPETLTKFLNYYGAQNEFYDQVWIEAAFEGTSTSGTNGVMNFSTFGFEERSSAIRTGIVAFRIWLFVLNAIDDAVAECGQSFGEQLGLKRWDHAVAAYSGSIPIQTTTPDLSLGYFLFTLAQTQCKYFGTCDPSTGMAKVNQEILGSFRNGRTQMVNADCDNLKLSAQNLRSLLTVPLLQGLLRSVHDIDQKDVKDGNRGAAAAYAAGLLPLLHDCSAGYAYSVYDNIRPGRIETVSFEVLKDALEQNYQCLGVTCQDIGGLVNYGGFGYMSGADPCGAQQPTPTPASPVQQPSPFANSYPGPSDDDNFVPSPGASASNSKPADDDDFQSSLKNQFRNADKKQALLIGLFSGLGVLAAIISIVVGCIDSKRAKEFDTANGSSGGGKPDIVEEDDVVISSQVEVV